MKAEEIREAKAAVFSIDKDTESALQDYLKELQRSDAVLSYFQLQGLLFAVSCSPEPMKASEWFELIWLNDDPQFDDEAEAKVFYRLVADLQKQIAAGLSRGHYLPLPVQFDERWQAELADWCQGLMLGHQYLEELWTVVIEDVADEEMSACVDMVFNLAATFADLESARQQALEDGDDLLEAHLPEAYALFQRALQDYSNLSAHWGKLISSMGAEQVFEALQPVGRDELCPCGSGKLFSRCCLH